jgi:hypothetical protein
VQLYSRLLIIPTSSSPPCTQHRQLQSTVRHRQVRCISESARRAVCSAAPWCAGAKPEPSRPSESRGQGLEAGRSYSTAAGITFDGSGITASAASASGRAPAHSEQSTTAGGSSANRHLVPNATLSAAVKAACAVGHPSPPATRHRPSARPAHLEQSTTAGGDALHGWRCPCMAVVSRVCATCFPASVG